MAVYTDVSDEALSNFLAEYDLPELVAVKGIAEGVENSNYLLRFADGRQHILTLYEKRVRPADLPFFLGLMDHLAARGIACPLPVHGRDGAALRPLCGRPAAMVTFLEGLSPKRPQPPHCQLLGAALARFHLAGRDYGLRRDNDLSLAGWEDLAAACSDRADEVSAGLATILTTEIATLRQNWPDDLPRGVIHADLFPDNVFFLGGQFSGMIDFYFACNDFLAYDLAVCVNAWCFESDLSFNITKAQNLFAAYQQVRPLSVAEKAALPILARGGAMRFLLTRLYDWLHGPKGALVRPKDPLEYLRKLRFHQRASGPASYGIA